ncbi:MAG: hypothetical protein C0594_11005 [Marinilabiliales bacterium]|nr:MAG: hypothetical protein C0594_11005 [Marinilabiliales bacterium]
MENQVRFTKQMNNNFFYIASRISKITWTQEEKDNIIQFCEGIKQDEKLQRSFFQYCKQWKLGPWVYVQLQKNHLYEHFSEAVILDFKDLHDKIKQQNQQRIDEAVKFLKLFKERNIPVAVLKGNLFMHTIYHDIGYKKMNDFDMLIHPEDWPKVQEIYDELNYIPLGFGWSGEKEEAAKFSHAGMSFISPNFHCITGTQWGIKSPTSAYTVNNQELWECTLEFQLQDTSIKKLSPEHNLLHLILHMGLYKIGIRDCMDVYNLMLAEKIDEDKFVAIAEESNAIEKAYFTLKISDHCSGTIPKSLLDKLQYNSKSFIIKRLKSRLNMLSQGVDLHRSYNDYFKDIEMKVFYFNLFPQFHKKFACLFSINKLLIWPKQKYVYKLNDISKSANILKKLYARIKAPWLVLKLVGEEIGVGIVFLLLLKLHIDQLLSLANYFRKKKSYFDYLEERGLQPEKIIKAVKNIE